MFIDQKYFAKNGDNIIFTGPYMEAYIPLIYFDKKCCEIIGNHFSVMGVFSFITFNDIEGKKPNPIRTMNIPVMISTFPSDNETKEIDLLNDKQPDTYLVLKYYKGDILTKDSVPQSTPVFQKFLNLLMSGKLPRTIAYKDTIEIWMKNFELNGISFDISRTVYEIVISKIYRNKNKPEENFGKLLGRDPKVSEYDYITASSREITGYSSRFSGIMFEDMDTQLISAISSTKLDKSETVSPMEQVLKY